MRFLNTNDILSGKADPPSWGLAEVLLSGQAPGKGLFVPERFVRYPEELIRRFPSMTYPEVAFEVLRPYFDEIPAEDFREIVRRAYGEVQAPVVEFEPGLYGLELFHNGTFAFKDFAALLLAATVEYLLERQGRDITVFVGTSGDTGPAIVEAFHRKKNIRVVCLFPERGVTPVQRRQMTTLGDNIIPVAVRGDFHDCQELAKAALEHPDFADLNPTSANSINWGRFIPQAVFAYWAYSRVAAYPEEVVLSIPTGNAGHIGSNLLARRETGGLPVARFVAPHNRNNYLVRMIESGRTEVEVLPTFDCLSNAMNVRRPNNIPRILVLYRSDIARMREEIWPVTVSDEETAATIREVYRRTGNILDVHSAVAWAGTLRFREAHPDLRRLKTVVFFTAHPAKFPEKIEAILGFPPPLPPKLARQFAAEEREVRTLAPGDLTGLRRLIPA